MSESRIVWSDEENGDVRKKNSHKSSKNEEVIEERLELHLRRLTSGKGRSVIEITNLPQNKNWCKSLAKELKKQLGVGGAYKQDFIEIHTKEIDKVTQFFNAKSWKWKKIGG